MKVHARQLVKAMALTLITALFVVPPALGNPTTGKSGRYSVHVYRLIDGRAPAAPLVTDHGGQNRGPAVQDLGPLDPWAYSLVHKSAPVQDLGPLDPWAYSLVHRSAATAAPANRPSATIESTGFAWRDAGIGAGVTVMVMLLIAGAMVLRRRRGVTHAHV
jgi:uncharacterized protein (TIGR03382 family)